MLQPDIKILLRAEGNLVHEPSRKPNSSGLKVFQVIAKTSD